MRQQRPANPNVSQIKVIPAGLNLGLPLSPTATHRSLRIEAPPSSDHLPTVNMLFPRGLAPRKEEGYEVVAVE